MNERLDNQNNHETFVSSDSFPLDKSASALAEQTSRDKFLDDFRAGFMIGSRVGAVAGLSHANVEPEDQGRFSPKTDGGYPRLVQESDRNYVPAYGSSPSWYHPYTEDAPGYEEAFPHSAGGSVAGPGSRSQESGIAPVQQDGYEYQSVVPRSSAGAQGHASSGRQSDAGSQSFVSMPPQSGGASGWSESSGVAMRSGGPVEGAPTAKPGLEMRISIARNPERMDLATNIVNDIVGGGTAAAYRAQVYDLSPGERLDLSRDLHATVADYNQQLGLTPGLDEEALVVDVRVGRDDEYVNDIDILRGFSSAAEPERSLERIDLYDPGFWTGLRSEGREVDQKQALDAVTAPYEMLARASLQATEAVNKRNPGDTVALREARARSLEGHDDYAVEKMLKDQYYSVSDRDDRAEALAENLKLNFAHPHSILLTENTRPLFVESSMTARNELRPSREVRELTDSFRTISKW